MDVPTKLTPREEERVRQWVVAPIVWLYGMLVVAVQGNAATPPIHMPRGLLPLGLLR